MRRIQAPIKLGFAMKNILLLEDLPEIRRWLKALVLQVFPDSTISEAARVHDALELIPAVKFDLALVDQIGRAHV